MRGSRRLTALSAALICVAGCDGEPASSAPPAELVASARLPLAPTDEHKVYTTLEYTLFGYDVAVSAGYAAVSSPTPEGGVVFFELKGTVWDDINGLHLGPVTSNTDDFGWSVAIDGETVVVGAPAEDFQATDAGAVLVILRGADAWDADAILRASDGQVGDALGSAVVIDGDTLLIGAPGVAGSTGAAYVFVRSGTSWSVEDKLIPSDGAPGDVFGFAVALEQDTAVIGAPGHGNGAAYVFTRNGTSWSEQQRLDGSTATGFGSALALSGTTLLVGQPTLDSGAGGVHVFRLAAGWQLDATLSASNAAGGDAFGSAIDLDGSRAIIGMDTPGVGSAHLFVDGASGFVEASVLQASDGSPGDGFGRSVGISGDHVLVGAPEYGKEGMVYGYRLAASNGAGCSADFDCASGFCVDGMCCNAACDEPCQSCTVAGGATTDGICGAATDGTGCDDGDACTQVDSCSAGTCVGGSPVFCDTSNECIERSTCDPDTGSCVEEPYEYSRHCGPNNEGECNAGTCVSRNDAGDGCLCRLEDARVAPGERRHAWALLVALAAMGAGRRLSRRRRRRCGRGRAAGPRVARRNEGISQGPRASPPSRGSA